MRQIRLPDETIEMIRRRSLYVCKFSLSGELVASTSNREIHPIGGYLDAFVAHVATPSILGDIELSLALNGVELLATAIPQGEPYIIEVLPEPVFIEALSDYLETTIVDVGSGAADFSAFGVFS